jgi:hypothetical protein
VSGQTQYGHEGQHHGTGAPGCPRELHHHHDERCVSPLNARRQRAELAGMDAIADPTRYTFTVARAAKGAIEVATRVQVTPEIIEAAILAVQHVPVLDRPQQAIIAAFRAAGFEVVE